MSHDVSDYLRLSTAGSRDRLLRSATEAAEVVPPSWFHHFYHYFWCCCCYGMRGDRQNPSAVAVWHQADSIQQMNLHSALDDLCVVAVTKFNIPFVTSLILASVPQALISNSFVRIIDLILVKDIDNRFASFFIGQFWVRNGLPQVCITMKKLNRFSYFFYTLFYINTISYQMCVLIIYLNSSLKNTQSR